MPRRSLLLLAEAPQDACLADVVRRLGPRYPRLVVTTDATVVTRLSPGSLVVLRPRVDQMGWLNSARPVLRQRELSVVLWMDRGAADLFAHHARDTMDWVSARLEVPDTAPAQAVAGLRARPRGAGVEWHGAGVEAALRGAGVRAATERLDAGAPWETLVAVMDETRSRWLLVRGVDSAQRLQRVRWASAAARRRGRVVLVAPTARSPGWWPVDGRLSDLEHAERRLAGLGFEDSGRLAASVGLDTDAIELMAAAAADPATRLAIERAAMDAEDASLGVAEEISRAGAVDWDGVATWSTSPTLVRALVGAPRARERRAQLVIAARQALRGGGDADGPLIAWWAASASRLPGRLDPEAPAAEWAAEVLLRRRPPAARPRWSADEVDRLTRAATRLGHGDVARWVRAAD